MIDDLYSARILKLAANLPHAGRLASPEGTGEQVAKLCGSRAEVDVTLDTDGRIGELARMLGGRAISDESLAHARQMLHQAQHDQPVKPARTGSAKLPRQPH